jgi:inner membrane protein
LDPLTQGLLGGAVAVSVAKRRQLRVGAAIGFVGAIVADADILIRSGSDPLLNVEYHRHFTHALVFIPVGALIAALLLWPLLHRRIDFRWIYAYALAGYATSGLLDACTSYGTRLLWPFSDTRIAWSIVSTIDPAFTVILLIALIWALIRHKPVVARAGLGLAGAYLLLGLWQHHNALQAARELAAGRGHEVERILVKPTVANLILWRSVYLSGGRFHVDAVRVGFGAPRIYPGSSVPRFDRARDRRDLPEDSVLANDIDRFERFSDGFVVSDPSRQGVLIDVRYSMLPTGITPIWGIDLNVESVSAHARFVNYRDRPPDYRARFFRMLRGRDPTD